MSNTLYHVSPRRNAASILENGLMAKLSTGRTVGVWLCEAHRLPWAVAHVANHHRVRPEDMSIFAVDASDIRPVYIRPGVLVHRGDIRPNKIGDVVYYAMGEP